MWVWHDTDNYEGQNWFWQFLISLKYQVFFCHFLPNTLKYQQWWILHGLRLTGTELGSRVQSWSCSSKLAPPGILYSLMFHWSLSWLRSFLSLLGDLHQLPHPALNTECLPHFCSPTGGWVLCLSTRTPLLDPAGTSSPLPRARRSFHCIFPVLTPFPWCYCWPQLGCQSVSGQQCSSSLVSFNKCVWKRLLAAEVWRAVTQRACRERVWCQDETHSSGCEAAAQRRVSAAH